MHPQHQPTPSQQRFLTAHKERQARIEAAAFRRAPSPAPFTRPTPAVLPKEVLAKREARPVSNTIPKAPRVDARTLSQFHQACRGILAGLPVRRIQLAVCASYGITLVQMKSKIRAHVIVNPRHVAIFLSRKRHPEISLPVLGRLFGGLDHTSVLHAYRRINAALELDSDLAAGVTEIEAELDR